MNGTVHVALGRGFANIGGTNESAIHWDIVKDLRSGGRIELDGEVVQVADPRDRYRPLCRLFLTDGSASTSAASERFVEVGSERFGHIVDPRSGRPVPAWGSVTVVGTDPFGADALSTALFVMGPAQAKHEFASELEASRFAELYAELVHRRSRETVERFPRTSAA